MRKYIYMIILAVCLLLAVGFYLLSGREYTHKPLVSQLPQEECYLCGERFGRPEAGQIGILDLNTWDLVCVDLELPEDGQRDMNYQIETGMQSSDGTAVEMTAYPNRGYAYGKISGCRYRLNRESIQERLCQACLNRINGTNFVGEAPAEYAVVDFTEKSIWILAKRTSWIYTEAYKIGCAFETDGTIKLLFHDRQMQRSGYPAIASIRHNGGIVCGYR